MTTESENIIAYLSWIPVVTSDEVPEGVIRLVSLNVKNHPETVEFSMKKDIKYAMHWCNSKNLKPVKFFVNNNQENINMFIDLYQTDENTSITLEDDRQTYNILKKLLKGS